MAVCEACGTRYTPTAQAPGCPSCAAPASKPAARPGAGAGAAKVVRRSPSPESSSTVARPAAQPARPAARPARPAAQAARPASAAPPAAAPSPARTAGAARPRPSAPPPPEDDEPIARRPRDDGAIDKTTKMGLMVTGGVALVVLVVVLWVRSKKEDERSALEAVNKQVASLYDELKGVSPDDEAAVNAALKHATEQEATWREHALAMDIQSLVTSRKNELVKGKERREFLGRFDTVESKLRGEALTGEKLKEIRRELDELEGKVSGAGADVAARFSLARTTADQQYAARLVEEVKASSSSENPRLVLVRAQVAEDEIKTLLDRSINGKNAELQAIYMPLYEQAVGETDRLATSIFSGGEADKLAWIDCLSGAQVANWNPSDVKGFSHRIEGGTLLLNGPDADAGRTAVISIGDREQWRNFMADMEFTIERGGFEIYYRLGRSANANTPGFIFRADGDKPNVQTERSYRVVATFLGSEYNLRFDNAPDIPNYQETLTWRKTRKGGIGLFVPPGARIKFTRFQVRELR